jgi:hypothetical protein
MSDSHTNPSGLPLAGLRTGTEELSVSGAPEEKKADDVRPAVPGAQRTPTENAIALPDTDAARKASAAADTPSLTLPPPLELPPGVQRPALGAQAQPSPAVKSEPAATAEPPAVAEQAAETGRAVEAGRSVAAGDAAVVEQAAVAERATKAEPAANTGLAVETGAAEPGSIWAAPTKPSTDTASPEGAAKQGPATGQFASRRERKLYETGAISMPTGKATPTGTPANAAEVTKASSVTAPTATPAAGATGESHISASTKTPADAAAVTTPSSITAPTKTAAAAATTSSITNPTKTAEATTPSSRKARKRSIGALITRILAALIAVAGIVLLVVGGLKATVWAPSDVVVGTLSGSSQKFVTAEIGALALAGPRLQVQVNGAEGEPVFIGVGRASDVDAYLGEAANDRIVGLDQDEGTLITNTSGADTTEVLDPASADVWSVSALGTGSAKLTWPEPASGQWRMVIATDGTRTAPQDVTLTWSGDEPENSAPAWIAVGIVLLVAGVVVSMLLRARARDRKEP